MAPKVKKKLPSVLSAIASDLTEITSRLADATATDWPLELLVESKGHATQIKRRANKLLKQADELIDTIRHRAAPLPQPEDEAPSMQQAPESDGHYAGEIRVGLAQLSDQTVPTIYQVMKDFPKCNEVGFYKATVEADVTRCVDLEKISRIPMNIQDWFQSKAVRLSPLPKRDRLHGLVCTLGIEEDDGSDFHVPELCWQDPGLDCRELFCSTIRNARNDKTHRYLVMPADSTSRWLDSVGLPSDLLDCGERLKQTRSCIPGVHTSYLYISASSGSGTALHVEDGYLGSINIVLAGAPKLWLMLEPCHRARVEDMAKQELRGKKHPCSQLVRHIDNLLSPDLLDRWKIPYRIVRCNPGEMVVTMAETYHQVVNAGPNISMAINFAGPDWTGPPETYVVCDEKCSNFPITLAQLQVHQSGHNSEAETTERTTSDSSGESLSNPNLQEDPLGLCNEELEETLKKAMSKDPTDNVEPCSGPPTPGDPSNLDPPEELRSATSALGNGSYNAPTPSEEPPTPAGFDNSPCETSISSTTQERSSEHTDGLRDSPSKSSTSPTTLTEPSEPPITPHDCPCEPLTPNTAPIEPNTQKCGGSTGEANGQANSLKNPIIISSDAQDKATDFVALPVYGPSLTPIVAETAEARIDGLIKRLTPFLTLLETTERAAQCFRPGQRLNDDAVILALRKILHPRAEPLIATWAIKDGPSLDLALPYTGTDSTEPSLRHNTTSECLCIAYNVDSSSLERVFNGSGDHWILIVVDFPRRKVHVFGNEAGHKKAETIAHNIGLLVNNYRTGQEIDPISWSNPETHPLFPTGRFPDGYNCGVAVISRAEAFLYPEKALKVSSSTTDAELSDQLNELRVIYLQALYLRCKRAYEDENEGYHLTPRPAKKRSYPFQEGDPPLLTIKKAHLEVQPSTSSSVAIVENLPSPPIIEIFPSEAERWESCLLQAAKKKGFCEQGILEAFKTAPADKPLDKIIRVLQFVCEAANPEILLKAKKMLLSRPKALEESPSDDMDFQKMVNYHVQIKKFGKVSYMALFHMFKCQVLYFEEFERLTAAKQDEMRTAKDKRDALSKRMKRKGEVIPKQSRTRKDKQPQAGDLIRSRAVEKIVAQTGDDPDTVHKDNNEYLKRGRVLHLLLNPQDTREVRRNLNFLSLLPLYDAPGQPPSLDFGGCELPRTRENLSKKMSGGELLGLAAEYAGFFGSSFLHARPEFRKIESCYLPRGEPDQHLPAHFIYLMTASDREIRETKPTDIASLFQPRENVTQLQLEFRKPDHL